MTEHEEIRALRRKLKDYEQENGRLNELYQSTLILVADVRRELVRRLGVKDIGQPITQLAKMAGGCDSCARRKIAAV